MGADVTVYQSIDSAVSSTFVGYDRLVHDSEISVLTTEDEIVQALVDGQEGTMIVKETPFYATSGGQEADTGLISCGDGEFLVMDTIKLQGGKIGHVGVVKKGMFKVGDTVHLSVDEKKRKATAMNHSATHLLQKALRLVLGNHVEQAGSDVNEDKLRFDFTHFSAMTPDEIRQVEDLVNGEINKGLPVVTEVMSLDDAKKSGAMALFGEKYGDHVRVVSMGDFSKELCGGTHADNTASIKTFKILSEAGVAAGVRRIEALTCDGVLEYYKKTEEELSEAAKTVKTDPALLVKRLQTMMEEIKELHQENEKLKNKLAKDALGDVMDQVLDVKGVKLLAVNVADVDMNGLMNLGDQLKTKLGEGVIVLASVKDNAKVSLLAMATEEAMSKGAHAGNLIKAIAKCVGGGGGGRPNMAQAGGKNPAGVEEALKEAVKTLEGQLS